MIRVADYIASFIYDLGVKEVFMVSGGLSMYLIDAVGKHDKIKYICCHHEQAATMAAEAYSRKSCNFGVAYVTAGPGATNTLTGLCGGWLDSAPFMVVAGQSKLSQIGINGVRQFGVQGFDIVPMFEKVTKYAVTIKEPQKIRYHLEKAVYLSKGGRPGPVWIEVPLDIQGALIDEENLIGFDSNLEKERDSIELALNTEQEIDKKVEEVIALISKSKRPLIIAGNGIRLSSCVSEFNLLVEKLQIPVVTSRLAIDIIDSNDDLFIGRPGTYGNRPGNFAVQNCDLLISIGCRLAIPLIGHDYKEFANKAIKVIIDIDKYELDKPTIKNDISINCDAKVFINKLSNGLDSIEVREECLKWKNQCKMWKERYSAVLPKYKETKNGISSYYFTEKLCELMENEEVIVLDTGSCFHSVSQSFITKIGQRFITTGGLSTMGYGLPASIGACIANNHKSTVCITGDGSFQMNIQELATIAYNKLPVKIFIFNNNGYLLIRHTQETFFDANYVGEGINSGIMCPSLEKIANAYEIKYIKIHENNEIESQVKKVLISEEAVICEIIIPEDEALIPKVASRRLDDGSLISMPYDDMYPFLDENEYLSNIHFTEK